MISLQFGDVRQKKIHTSNHFVSHMIEHIAWRMGLMIRLEWHNEDWRALGQALGEEIAKFPRGASEASAIGMIDDGSAAVGISCNKPSVEFSAVGGVDLEWFLACRCEQIDSGEPLIELANGLSEGLQLKIAVQIWSVEDPHHTWEGIYRGIGLALAKLYTPTDARAAVAATMAKDRESEYQESDAEVAVLERSAHRAKVRRGTAETGISVDIDFTTQGSHHLQIDADASIAPAVAGADVLLQAFATALGARLSVDFKATMLSSSHVVMEDIGLVIGRALLEILKLRMEKYGVDGAGSTLSTADDIRKQNLRVGVSIEGRKFWKFIPEDGDFAAFRRLFMIGQDVSTGLRSEDLDDFIDGIAGGLSASIMVHIKDYNDPKLLWPQIFEQLGLALHEAFQVNPYRRGVPPGVKATLA